MERQRILHILKREKLLTHIFHFANPSIDQSR